MLVTASLAAIDFGRIFLVQNEEGFWTLPGGKLNPGETERIALERELNKELPSAVCVVGSFWQKIKSLTPTSKQEVEVHVFLGALSGDLKPGAEIKASRWFTLKEAMSYKLSPPSLKIIGELVGEGKL